jgi:uncharacterized protein YjdB
MALYQVAWNPTTKTATIATDGTALPGGSTKLGTFHHFHDPADERGHDVHHVLFQHVRDMVYPLGQWNMQEVTIAGPGKLIPTQKVKLQEQIDSVNVGKTLQLQWFVEPQNADNVGVTFASSDTAKATVTAAGQVKGVAPGQVQITVTTAEGGKTAVAYLTVAP